MSNKIIIKPNGPLIAQGRVRVENDTGELVCEDSEVFLCRCGHSSNKPFCDGTHKQYAFSDAALIRDDKAEQLLADAPLLITIRSNAMLIVKGPMTISSKDGSTMTTRNKAALCRCGHSQNKPFCDASHKRCEFDDKS